MIAETDLHDIELAVAAHCSSTDWVTYIGGSIFLDEGDVHGTPFTAVALQVAFPGIGFKKIMVVSVCETDTVDSVAKKLCNQILARYEFARSQQLPP